MEGFGLPLVPQLEPVTTEPLKMNFDSLDAYPAKFKAIRTFYEWSNNFPRGRRQDNNPFDFYLDFIGYSIDRLGAYRYMAPVHKAEEFGFGHHERCLMADALKVFENTGYEDVYRYIDLLQPTLGNRSNNDLVEFAAARSRG
tara:strand:- start:639 stop:1064 length:426 start_codon:yes stop_codon:yes gene_type:complete